MIDFLAAQDAIGSELWLVALGLIGVLLGALLKDAFNSISFKFGAFVLFIAAGIAYVNMDGGSAFNNLVNSNSFVNFAKIISYIIGGITLIISENFLKRHSTLRYEYSLLTIFACFGMGIILSASDLMTLYMGIETLSLSSYVMAAFHRDSSRSAEAGLKYFVLGALASGMLLYGASLIYGFTGTTQFAGIAAAEVNIGYLFGLVLMIVGLAFKVSAAPMHIWTPDVYEGAPTPVVAFFAAASKMATLVVFAHVMFSAFGDKLDEWQLVLAIIAGMSMLIGSFGALTQTNIKRLLGYSSIANVGYALIAVAAGQEIGADSLLLFATIYVVASLGLFAGVLSMRREGGMVENINELGGLMRSRPIMTIALSVLIWSIAGLPPFGGFFGKLAIVNASLEADLLPLAIILVIASVVSLGYYLRLIKIMWADDPKPEFERVDSSVVTTVVLTALISGVLFMVFIQYLSNWTGQATLGLGG